MSEKLEIVSADADLANADWTKQAWDFPPYKSPDFMTLIGSDLDAFRKLPVYKAAIDKGLIHDDEWVGDYCKPAPEKKKEAKDSGRHIHIHLPRKGKA